MDRQENQSSLVERQGGSVVFSGQTGKSVVFSGETGGICCL